MQVRQPTAGSGQRAARVVMHRAPGRRVARMPGEFGPPQERRAIRHFLLRSAAMPVEREVLAKKPERLGGVAGFEFAKREMPIQMAVEKSLARIGGEPGRQETAGRGRLAFLVADVRERVRAMRVVRIEGNRSLDLHAGRRVLAVLRQRHGMMGQKPEIVAVVRGEAVHTGWRSGASARCGRRRR